MPELLDPPSLDEAPDVAPLDAPSLDEDPAALAPADDEEEFDEALDGRKDDDPSPEDDELAGRNDVDEEGCWPPDAEPLPPSSSSVAMPGHPQRITTRGIAPSEVFMP